MGAGWARMTVRIWSVRGPAIWIDWGACSSAFFTNVQAGECMLLCRYYNLFQVPSPICNLIFIFAHRSSSIVRSPFSIVHRPLPLPPLHIAVESWQLVTYYSCPAPSTSTNQTNTAHASPNTLSLAPPPRNSNSSTKQPYSKRLSTSLCHLAHSSLGLV